MLNEYIPLVIVKSDQTEDYETSDGKSSNRRDENVEKCAKSSVRKGGI
jgi:hypothetical protein